MANKTRKINRRRIRAGEMGGGISAIYSVISFDSINEAIYQITLGIIVPLNDDVPVVPIDLAQSGYPAGSMIDLTGAGMFTSGPSLPVTTAEILDGNRIEVVIDGVSSANTYQFIIPPNLDAMRLAGNIVFGGYGTTVNT